MQTLVEKHSPVFLSVILHAALLLLLLTTWSEPPKPAPRIAPLFIQVMRPEPLPEPSKGAEAPGEQAAVQQTNAEPVPSAPPEPQRTSPDANEKENPEPFVVLNPVKPDPDPPPNDANAEKPQEQPVPPQSTATPTPTPATAGPRPLAEPPVSQEMMEQFRASVEKTLAEQQAQKSKVIAQVATITNSAEAGGVKRPYASAGSNRGTVREIDIARYPKPLQERFIARYKIKIREMYVQDGGRSDSYVNAVTTNRGIYSNSNAAGRFEVMILSQEVYARMARLEEEELIKRGLKPTRALVREISFGLREEPNGEVDLFVTRFRADPIE